MNSRPVRDAGAIQQTDYRCDVQVGNCEAVFNQPFAASKRSFEPRERTSQVVQSSLGSLSVSQARWKPVGVQRPTHIWLLKGCRCPEAPLQCNCLSLCAGRPQASVALCQVDVDCKRLGQDEVVFLQARHRTCRIDREVVRTASAGLPVDRLVVERDAKFLCRPQDAKGSGPTGSEDRGGHQVVVRAA